MLGNVKNNGNSGKSVLVEAGHIYTNQVPNNTHFMGAKYGVLIGKYLEAQGVPVKKMLFIDDYNPKFGPKTSTQLNIEKYIKSLKEIGYVPDEVIFESELVPKAKEIIAALHDNGHTKEKTNELVLRKNGDKKAKEVRLFTNWGGVEKISCAVLDASLYSIKNGQADTTFTILDNSGFYVNQQKYTGFILNKMAKVGLAIPNIYALFHSPEGPSSELSYDIIYPPAAGALNGNPAPHSQLHNGIATRVLETIIQHSDNLKAAIVNAAELPDMLLKAALNGNHAGKEGAP